MEMLVQMQGRPPRQAAPGGRESSPPQDLHVMRVEYPALCGIKRCDRISSAYPLRAPRGPSELAGASSQQPAAAAASSQQPAASNGRNGVTARTRTGTRTRTENRRTQSRFNSRVPLRWPPGPGPTWLWRLPPPPLPPPTSAPIPGVARPAHT
jgi:hypothetical protein